MYFVENEVQSGSDVWQIANVVGWRRQRLPATKDGTKPRGKQTQHRTYMKIEEDSAAHPRMSQSRGYSISE